MKKHYILNRPMFNRGGVSAYGKGITSNLVTEEQRQRFNYGGRVRAKDGLYSEWDYGLDKPWPSILTPSKWDPTWRYEGSETNQEDSTEEVVSKQVLEGSKLSPMDTFYRDELNKARFGESDKYTTSPEGIGLIEKLPVVEDEDEGDDGTKKIMTDSDWMDLLGPTEEQKRRTKGEAQLNLAAGALDVFSQPTIAKGMKAASPHLSKLAQTVSADQKARDKAILQGKVLSKVYTDRAGAKGEADVKTLEAKAKIVEKSDTPRAFYEAAKVKDKMKDAMSKALNYTIQTVKKDDNGIPIIPEGTTEDTVMWDDAFMILKDGDLVPITVDKIFALKKK